MPDVPEEACLEEDVVVALFEGRLSPLEMAQVEGHIDGCATCRELLSNVELRSASAGPASARAEVLALDLPARRLAIGTVLEGRFTIEAFVAAGGMGEVYRARAHADGRHGEDGSGADGVGGEGSLVAVKVVRHMGDELQQRFEREVSVLAGLSHPAIVRYLGHGVVSTTGGARTPFLAMAWLEGESLASRLARGPLTVDETVRLGLRLSGALGAAHARRITHRDVKPSNVLLVGGDVDRAVLVDFGVARAPEATLLPSTRTGALVGTLGYMAPEQARGAKTVDARADVFSLGCVLHECVTGERAFAGSHAVEVLARLLAEPVRRIRQSVPDAPVWLDDLVERMLRKPPLQRPADGTMVETILSGRVGRVGTARRTRSRKWLGAAGLAAALTSVGGVALVRSTRGDAPVAPAAAASDARLLASAPTRASAPPVAVLLMGIDNQTPDPSLEGTLDEVLASALNRSLALNTFRSFYVKVLATDFAVAPTEENVARALAKQRGGRVLVAHGEVVGKGSGYTLSLRLTELASATGAADDAQVTPPHLVLSASRDAADLSRVVPTLGRLASDVRAAVGDPPPTGDEEKTGSSASLDADHESWVARGLGSAGRYQEAVLHAQRALALDPSFSREHHALSVYLGNLDRHAEAVEQVKLALATAASADVGGRELTSLRAAAASLAGDEDGAVAALETLLEQMPFDNGAEANLVVAYWKKRDVAAAAAMARREAVEHPGSMLAQTNRACIEVYSGHIEAAARDAELTLARRPHPSADNYLYAGIAEALLGRTEDARRSYQELEARAPGVGSPALADLALSQESQPSKAAWEEVEAQLERSVHLVETAGDGEGAALRSATLAEVQLQRGDRTRAADSARRALAHAGPGALYVAGRVLLESGHVAEASAVVARLGRGVSRDERLYGGLLEVQIHPPLPGAPLEAAFAKLSSIRDAWIVHYERARMHLARGERELAIAELRLCEERRGEGALAALTDDAPTLRYVTHAHALLQSLVPPPR